MKKSFCYRACRDANKNLYFEKTPSLLEIVTDRDGNEFRIHLHKIGEEWSATEESTGLRCVPAPDTYRTKDLCLDAVRRVTHLYDKLINRGEAPMYKRELMLYKKSLEETNNGM